MDFFGYREHLSRVQTRSILCVRVQKAGFIRKMQLLRIGRLVVEGGGLDYPTVSAGKVCTFLKVRENSAKNQ